LFLLKKTKKPGLKSNNKACELFFKTRFFSTLITLADKKNFFLGAKDVATVFT